MTIDEIGLYGGTFDPIHFGHLNLAVELMEKGDLEEVWFCPAWISPHKVNDEPTLAHHRLKMVELAIERFPSFKLIDVEVRREGPSFTIDTLTHLQQKHPNKKFNLLLGSDSIENFHRWKEPENLLSMVTVMVGMRNPKPPDWDQIPDDSIKEKLKLALVSTPILDITATTLRERLAAGLPCAHLVPGKVLDYIFENHLYSS